jgi:hypothetical protein
VSEEAIAVRQGSRTGGIDPDTPGLPPVTVSWTDDLSARYFVKRGPLGFTVTNTRNIALRLSLSWLASGLGAQS